MVATGDSIRFSKDGSNWTTRTLPKEVRIDLIDCDLGDKRTLDIRETPEFLAVAQRVREGLRAGHSYDD